MLLSDKFGCYVSDRFRNRAILKQRYFYCLSRECHPARYAVLLGSRTALCRVKCTPNLHGRERVYCKSTCRLLLFSSHVQVVLDISVKQMYNVYLSDDRDFTRLQDTEGDWILWIGWMGLTTRTNTMTRIEEAALWYKK
jgi:hypothetical protein